MPSAPGWTSFFPTTCVTMSARHWRSWKCTRQATWLRSDQRRRSVVLRTRGNSNLQTTYWTKSNGTKKTCAGCLKHGVMCALCRRYERIWQQRTDPKKQLYKHAVYWNELQKKMKISKPGDNIMVPVPDLDRTKIDARILPVLSTYILTLVLNKILY